MSLRPIQEFHCDFPGCHASIQVEGHTGEWPDESTGWVVRMEEDSYDGWTHYCPAHRPDDDVDEDV